MYALGVAGVKDGCFACEGCNSWLEAHLSLFLRILFIVGADAVVNDTVLVGSLALDSTTERI